MPIHQDQKPEMEPVEIWRCRSNECIAWIRNEFVTSSKPECPLCKGEMIRGLKHLPKLAKRYQSGRKKKPSEEESLVH